MAKIPRGRGHGKRPVGPAAGSGGREEYVELRGSGHGIARFFSGLSHIFSRRRKTSPRAELDELRRWLTRANNYEAQKIRHRIDKLKARHPGLK